MARVLIDADPLVYSNGFAAEQRVYIVSWLEVDPDHPDDPDKDYLHQHEFHYVEEIADWRFDQGMDDKAYDELFITDKIALPEPLSHCLHLVRSSIENIELAVAGALAEVGEEVETLELYLSGSVNFRNDIATIRPYKGNRDPSAKPYWYKEIRDYLVNVWGAKIVEPWEADDWVSIQQTNDPDNTIICTIDKDLNMVPGFHYNYRTKEFHEVSWSEARAAFYRQLLTGDTTDNIPGCYRVGKATAAKLITEDMSEEEMYDVVLKEYQKSIDKYGDKTGYAHMTAEAALLENARLLWMLEYEGQLWTPPGQPDEEWKVMSDD